MSTFWLSEFAYKTAVGFRPFAVAAFISVAIAMGSTGYQAFKASRLDPAQTLRNE